MRGRLVDINLFFVTLQELAVEPEILLLDEGIGAVDAAFLEKSKKRLSELVERSGLPERSFKRRFRAATGRTGTPAPDDTRFSQWRRDQVTNTVQRSLTGAARVFEVLDRAPDAFTKEDGEVVSPPR